MNSIKLRETDRVLSVVSQDAPLVAWNDGVDSITVEFTGEEWEVLTKVAVFKGHGDAVEVEYEDGMTIPKETIERAGLLFITIEGYDGDTKVLSTGMMAEPIGIEPAAPRT